MKKLNKETGTIYSRAELTAAFEKVQNKADWKAPISAYIPKEELNITKESIIFFTATQPVFVPNGDQYYVSAAGYRNGPAGDH